MDKMPIDPSLAAYIVYEPNSSTPVKPDDSFEQDLSPNVPVFEEDGSRGSTPNNFNPSHTL